MQAIKVTTKRQATLPIQLCHDMGIEPGDKLILEQRYIEGEVVWIIHSHLEKVHWMGALRKYAKNKSHHINDIRRSIASANRR